MIGNVGTSDDCWDAFGSDEDEDDDDEVHPSSAETDVVPTTGRNNHLSSKRNILTAAATQIATFWTQDFVRRNSQVRLEQRKVLLLSPVFQEGDDDSFDRLLSKAIVSALQQRGMQTEISLDRDLDNGDYVDGVTFLDPNLSSSETLYEIIEQRLCPGGTVIIPKYMDKSTEETLTSQCLSQTSEDEIVCHLQHEQLNMLLISRQKKPVRAHASTCPWLPSSHSISAEEQRLQQATVTLSSYEITSSRLLESSVKKAVHNMQAYGYCILPRLLPSKECEEWGRAVLDSVHEAAKILRERDGVDIYHPQSSKSEPQSYQELSMREDLRLDIRQGPALSRIRWAKRDGEHGNESIVLTAASHDYQNGIFLRGHASLLEIIRRTMNPKDDSLYKGNMGRWNFGGSGSDGSFQNLRLSPVGGIVSLPGAADQALHADTSHLFENIPNLPAHYINIFAPCTKFHEEVGGTAFVHGGHNLAFTAKYCGNNDDNNSSSTDNSRVYPYLVRPALTVGDVVLFDCRILHFGLANTSSDMERCICYTNTWQNWFHDAKNWDQNRAIFSEKEE